MAMVQGAELNEADLKRLLKRVVELVMPDMRHYYRLTRKGRIVKSYASDGSYWADVQPLRNDESNDPREPVIPRVEIPILWAGPGRGVVCPPAAGALCDITYYDGDPNYPRISNFRWGKGQAPTCVLDAFLIAQSTDCYFLIKPGGGFELKGHMRIIGDIVATGDISDQDGTKSMAGMRTVYDRHSNPNDGPPPEKM